MDEKELKEVERELKIMLVWFFVNICFSIIGITLALVSIGGGGEIYGNLALAFATVGITSTLLFNIWGSRRPYRGGSPQYQKLKKVTYKQLKSGGDVEKVKQAFYLNAEKCNVTHNTYDKDFGLIVEALKQ